MATVTHIGTLPDSANKSDFYAIIDNATVTGIVNSDISNSAGIVDTKLAQITTAAKVSGTAITGALASTITATTQTEGNNSTKIATTAYADGKISKTIAGEINAMTEKISPIDADVLVIEDSANSYAKRKVQIGNIKINFGTWNSSSYSTGNNYHATTDGFVIGIGNNNSPPTGYTDSASTPTTIRAKSYTPGADNWSTSIMFPVRSGDYWKVTNCNQAVYWLPLS